MKEQRDDGRNYHICAEGMWPVCWASRKKVILRVALDSFQCKVRRMCKIKRLVCSKATTFCVCVCARATRKCVVIKWHWVRVVC